MEDKEPKISYKKTGIIVMLSGFIILLVVLFVASCSITKKASKKGTVETKSKITAEIETINTDEETESKREKETDSEFKETSSKKEEIETSSVKAIEETKSGVEAELKIESSEVETIEKDTHVESDKMLEVMEPSLSEVSKVTTLVSGKKIFKYNNLVYVYCIDLVFPSESDYPIISYFCSKKVYDAVSDGESLDVEYQTDQNGLVSIISVSR